MVFYDPSLPPTIDESVLTAGCRVRPGNAYGFLTDTTLCIGCKACEVACKQWNQLPADDVGFTATSYDNTGALSANTWRHVKFVEQFSPDRQQERWLFLSDICKHCVRAGCHEACPTGAITRTEFDTVLIQQDICNGCGYCVPACPFGVISLSKADAKAHKCTLCYDRLKDGLEPACAKACPTDSIQFGPLSELRPRARRRLAELKGGGFPEAMIYGEEEIVGGLNSFFILMDEPEVYGLPRRPRLPSANIPLGSAMGIAVAGLLGITTALAFFGRQSRPFSKGRHQ